MVQQLIERQLSETEKNRHDRKKKKTVCTCCGGMDVFLGKRDAWSERDRSAFGALCKVRYRYPGRRSTFARSGLDFVAGAAFSHSHAQISWQPQLTSSDR